MDLNKFILNTDQYNNLIARSSEYFPELVEKYKDIFDDEQNTPEIIDKILIEWEQEIGEKHKKALQKCNTNNAKIRYAYSQGYVETFTIANFLISQGYDINKRTIVNNLYQIKVQTKPIDNNLRSEQHIEQLQKCNTNNAKIRYAYSQGYVETFTIANFLISQGYGINAGTIANYLRQIKIEAKPINNNLRNEQHIEQLKKCKNNSTRINYAYQQGYIGDLNVYDFLKANDVVISFDSIKNTLSQITSYKRPINNSLKHEKHIEYLKKCKGSDAQIEYAYHSGCRTSANIFDFLRVNKCNPNIRSIEAMRSMLPCIFKCRQTSNNELENEKHIEFLRKCKTKSARVQYAYEQGYTKVFEIYNFLKTNGYTISPFTINKTIYMNSKIQGKRKINDQAQPSIINNKIIADVNRSNLLIDSPIENIDKANGSNPSTSIETANMIKNFTTNYSFFTENNTHNDNRNMQISSQQKNQAKQRKL